jgi:hypothetical protein
MYRLNVFSTSSRNRLTARDAGRFGGSTLFDRLGRAVCRAGCLPRKELYEAWEVARRARRVFRGGRVVDLAGGHGVLAAMMILLDGSSPSAVVVDPSIPPSADKVLSALTDEWPRLSGRVSFESSSLRDFALGPTDVVVSSHACGALTDVVLERAALARARVAVLPCCHDDETCDAGSLAGWLDTPLAIDIMRVVRLEQHGYRVRTQVLPVTITPKNRLILGEPPDQNETEMRKGA